MTTNSARYSGMFHARRTPQLASQTYPQELTAADALRSFPAQSQLLSLFCSYLSLIVLSVQRTGFSCRDRA